ncbi:hypothetical protein TIFTF001_018471 [Ficus carica]|uniref:Uncharacterized protein n=1 Tax=Ficus carica TaxID=3494 RepID=A0AA88AS01_FICCA|nr:hypothetical protein TIFTF001_018471 [Ficus carica]
MHLPFVAQMTTRKDSRLAVAKCALAAINAFKDASTHCFRPPVHLRSSHRCRQTDNPPSPSHGHRETNQIATSGRHESFAWSFGFPSCYSCNESDSNDCLLRWRMERTGRHVPMVKENYLPIALVIDTEIKLEDLVDKLYLLKISPSPVSLISGRFGGQLEISFQESNHGFYSLVSYFQICSLSVFIADLFPSLL